MVEMLEILKAQLLRDGEILLRVKVRPGSPTSRMRGPLGEDTFKVDVAAPAEDGKANDELARFLAREFCVKPRDIVILSGETARLKVLRISRPSGGTAGEFL